MSNSDKDKFVSRVLDRLIKDEREYWVKTEPLDKKQIIFSIEDNFDNGFSVIDSIRYSQCMAEYNPDIAEETAVETMSKIRQKYT